MGREQETHDITATSWHTPASDEPPKYAILLSNKLNFPISLIRQSGVFCVNFMSYEYRDSAAFVVRHSREHTDKITDTDFSLAECERIDCPRISEAVGFLECELDSEQDLGDHTLFVGKVMGSHLESPKAKRLFMQDKGNFTTTN
jgi:flavin reductase (DIM6/NTAB) family NADH-FMN oxidoreductase RutF